MVYATWREGVAPTHYTQLRAGYNVAEQFLRDHKVLPLMLLQCFVMYFFFHILEKY